MKHPIPYHPNFNQRTFIQRTFISDPNEEAIPTYNLYNLPILLLGEPLLLVMPDWDEENHSMFTFGSRGKDPILLFNLATLSQ